LRLSRISTSAADKGLKGPEYELPGMRIRQPPAAIDKARIITHLSKNHDHAFLSSLLKWILASSLPVYNQSQ
jgi:hypothetical protein